MGEPPIAINAKVLYDENVWMLMRFDMLVLLFFLGSMALCVSVNGSGAYYQPIPDSSIKERCNSDRQLVLEPFKDLKGDLADTQSSVEKISESARNLCEALSKATTLMSGYWKEQSDYDSLLFSGMLTMRGVVRRLLSLAEGRCDTDTKQLIKVALKSLSD